MKKRLLTALLSATMVMSAFAGVPAMAEEANTDLSGTLTILSWYNYTGRSSYQTG